MVKELSVNESVILVRFSTRDLVDTWHTRPNEAVIVVVLKLSVGLASMTLVDARMRERYYSWAGDNKRTSSSINKKWVEIQYEN